MLKAGVIGLGEGKCHCRAYQESEECVLAAICDRDEGRLQKGREMFPGVKTFLSIDDFLKEDLDIVSISTPDDTHCELAVKTLESGRHLLLEKPMAVKQEDCGKITQAAEKAGVTLGIAYEFRRNPVVLELKKLIDEGTLGNLSAVSIYYWRKSFSRAKIGKWIQEEKHTGGLLVSETSHYFDLLRFFGGDIEKVHCLSADNIHSDFNFEDIAYVNAVYTSGAIAQVAHTLSGFDGPSTNFWITGTEGSAWAIMKERDQSQLGLDGYYGLVSWRKHLKPEDFSSKGIVSPDADEKYPVIKKTFGFDCKEVVNIKDTAKAFVSAIIDKKSFSPSPEDGLKALQIALAAKSSAKTGDVVYL